MPGRFRQPIRRRTRRAVAATVVPEERGIRLRQMPLENRSQGAAPCLLEVLGVDEHVLGGVVLREGGLPVVLRLDLLGVRIEEGS